MGKRAKQLILGDRTIWVLVVLLSLVSLVEVYSSIGKAAYDHGWNIWATVFKHVVIVALSYVIMIAISHVPFKWFSSLSRLQTTVTYFETAEVTVTYLLRTPAAAFSAVCRGLCMYQRDGNSAP